MKKFDVHAKAFSYLGTTTCIAILLSSDMLSHPKVGETVRVVVPKGNVAIAGRDCIVKSISIRYWAYTHCFHANVQEVDNERD